jgi:hypothetical protein
MRGSCIPPPASPHPSLNIPTITQTFQPLQTLLKPLLKDHHIVNTHVPLKMSDDGPITAYPAQSIKPQDQTGGPGLDKNTDPYAEWSRLEFWDENNKPYLKEYEGRGLLQNKAALITGGDSGIGRSVAILFAREGADVSIVYLPEEEEDAQYVKKKVEEAGRKANLMQFDLKVKENCEKAVEGHMKAFGKLNVLVNNGNFPRPCDNRKSDD